MEEWSKATSSFNNDKTWEGRMMAAGIARESNGLQYIEVKECAVCTYKEGSVYDKLSEYEGEEVVMCVARCAHDVCMRCFETLVESDEFACVVCRRPSYAPIGFMDGDDGHTQWVDSMVYSPTMGLSPKLCPERIAMDLMDRGGARAKLDAIEVMGIFIRVFQEKIPDFFGLLLEDGGILKMPYHLGGEGKGCVFEDRSAPFFDKLDKDIRLIAQRVCFEVSKRTVTERSGVRPLIDSSDLPTTYSLMVERLACLVDLMRIRHLCSEGRLCKYVEALCFSGYAEQSLPA